jgi:hypothetical protein
MPNTTKPANTQKLYNFQKDYSFEKNLEEPCERNREKFPNWNTDEDAQYRCESEQYPEYYGKWDEQEQCKESKPEIC